MTSFKYPAALPRGRRLQHQLNGRLYGSHTRSGSFEEEKISFLILAWSGLRLSYPGLCFWTWNHIIIIIIIIISPFMQGIYNYIPDTNHVCRVYNVQYIFCLQFIIHISLMSCFQVCCSTISWMTFWIIIIIIIIMCCEDSDVIMAEIAYFVQILTMNCVWPRRAGFEIPPPKVTIL